MVFDFGQPLNNGKEIAFMKNQNFEKNLAADSVMTRMNLWLFALIQLHNSFPTPYNYPSM